MFTGLISGHDKYCLLRDADVFFMPSRYEGLSIALLEAMASGLPVVLSDSCGLHREIQSNACGLIVQPTINSVSSAMITMETPELRAMYGKNSRDLVLSHYTWPKITKDLEQTIMSHVANA